MKNMEEIGRTAFFIAYWRDQESSSKNPLFVDPYARYFLDQDTKNGAFQLEKALPEVKAMIRYRVKYIDDMLSKLILLGTRQILILGSGFDTRSLRIMANDVNFFEIDTPAVMAFKKKTLNDNDISTKSIYIACDYIKNEMIPLLTDHCFNFSMPTYVIWEGNTFYLPREKVMKILGEIRKIFDSFTISFDYISSKVVSRTTGYQGLTNIVSVLEKSGSPFITGLTSIDEVSNKFHLEVIENLTMADLAQKYQEADIIDLNILKEYSICTLNSY